MNKKSIFVLLLLLSYFNVFSQQTDVDIKNATPNYGLKNTNLFHYKLTDKVKVLKNLVHEPIEKFGEISKGKIVEPLFGSHEDNFKLEFNEIGLLTQYIRFNESGARSYFTEFIYNSKNNKKEIKRTNSKDIITLLQKFEHNRSNQIITEYNQYWEKDESRIKYEYNTNYQLIHKTIDNGLNNTDYNFKYSYKNNRISEILLKTGNGKFESLEKISFSGKNISEIQELDQKGELIKIVKFKFDNRNNLIYKSVTNKDEKEPAETFFQFNKYNHLTIKKQKNFKIKFVYKYDKKFNWISKIKYVNGIAKYVINREIEYYK